MYRPLSAAVALVLALAFGVCAAAQEPAAAAARESKFVGTAVATLHQLADALEAQKQHGRAHELRLEILHEYSEDDAKAREACGYLKVGDLWQPDPNKLVLEKDLTGDKKVLKKIDAELVKFRKGQLAEHRALAEAWTAAGDRDRASQQWRRVLALDPDDPKAASSLAVSRFQGFRGTDAELAMLRRAFAIRGGVAWLLRHEFAVHAIEGRKHPLLERAGINHVGLFSDHFEAWGTLPPEQMGRTLQNCERALLMCRTIFGTAGGEIFAPRKLRNFVFVGDGGTYGRLIDACADQFDAARMEFLKTQVDMAFLKVGDAEVRCIKSNGSEEQCNDQSVRGVVQDATGVHTDGLWEGIGHAACGALFGRTITFMLEQQKDQTVASWAQKLLAPDIKKWMEIAKQSAWAKTDTRTSELVLLSAARFSSEQRVKSWAICDYFFLWRPELIWELDACRTDEIHTPPDVEAEFLRRTGLELPRIDLEWRDYWARHDELRAAMAQDPLGDEKQKDHAQRLAARALVDAIDELRIAAGRGPVGYYFAEDADAQAAMQYADRLVKAERDQQKKQKEVIPLPEPPPALGRTILFSRANEPMAAVLEWWSDPAQRDAMLHAGRGLLGANENKNCRLLDLGEPVQPTVRGKPQPWPIDGQKAVPGSARAPDLGPRVRAAMAAAGHASDGTVAMPWTLHFHRALGEAEIGEIRCEVFYDGIRAEGVLVSCQGNGDADADTAPGCIAYACYEAPKPGAHVEVGWTIPKALLAKDEVYRPITFVVQ
ncbi:MAG: hypothetical protein U1E73_09175 [Planctomycetota bacterium]